MANNHHSAARRNAEMRVVAATFVNYDTPDGGMGSIRVDRGTPDAAVEIARAAGGTNIWVRDIDAFGHCTRRVAVL